MGTTKTPNPTGFTIREALRLMATPQAAWGKWSFARRPYAATAISWQYQKIVIFQMQRY
jgi:hypothetical protein